MGKLTPYSQLTFPGAPEGRPYTFINMISTIDGKILSGERNESVHDLGSVVDHQTMKTIASVADAVMVGASTLRTSAKSWNPGTQIRMVVSRSGALPWDHDYFKGRSILATTKVAKVEVPSFVEVLRTGNESVDLRSLWGELRQRGVLHLLLMGGSELNAQALALDLVDELFLTIAPKVKLGRDVPTYADGESLDRNHLHQYQLLECHPVESEVYLRYRRL